MQLRLSVAVTILSCIISHVGHADTAADLARALSAADITAKASDKATSPTESYADLDKAISLATDSKRKQSYMQTRAWLYMRDRRYQDVLTACRSMIEQYPDAAEPYRCMAEAYGNMQKMDGCYAAHAKAIDLAKDPYLNRSYRLDQAWAYNKGRKYESVLAACQSMIKDYPDAPEPHRCMAEGYLNLNKLPECYNEMSKAVELAADPQMRKSYRLDKASYYARGRRYADALAQYQSLTKDFPDAAKLYMGMAECYYNLGKLPDCYAAVDKAVERASDVQLKRKYTQEQASFYSRRNDYGGALTVYQALVKENPDAPAQEIAGWYRLIGECYVHLGKLGDCHTAMAKAIEMATDPAAKKEYRVRHASMLARDPNCSDPLAEYRILIRDYPTAFEPYLGMSGYYSRAKKRNECYAAGDKAIELAPDPATKYSMMFYKAEFAAMTFHDYDLGIGLFQKLLVDYPDNKAEILPMLTYALQKTGRIEEAVKMARSGLPKDATAEQESANAGVVAGIYFNNKRYREAAEAYKEVMNSNGAMPDTRAQASYQLALCYDKSGLARSARVYMLRVSERYPGTEVAKKARGMLYVWDMYGVSPRAK